MIDVLEHLSRNDKWYLGGAPALLFAPPAPIWLDKPGCWDMLHYLHFPIEPGFTLALIDEAGKEVPLRLEDRRWRPDRLMQHYRAPGLTMAEHKTCGPEDALAAVIAISNEAATARKLQLVVWTAQPVTDASFHDAGHHRHTVFIQREVEGLRKTNAVLSLALGMEGARSYSVDLSEPTANHPHLHLSPYAETLTPAGLDNQVKLTGVNRNGLVYAALERPIMLAPGEQVSVKVTLTVATETVRAVELAQESLQTDPLQRSEQAWQSYFASIPDFSCSDPYLETYYWYRWYGLRLNTISAQIGNYYHPAVAEGIGYFRVPISYSAQCHMLEARWLKDPKLAQGSLLNFVENQREDGSFPNHIHVDYIAPEGIYHADWGQRTLDLHHVHPDPALLEKVYPAFKRYVEYFYQARDPQNSGLYDHINQWESGQEYMSRYVWVDDQGDEWKALTRRLKGLDASIYIYRLERALATISTLLGLGEESYWTSRAERTKAAILQHCWNEELQAFVDLSPELEQANLIFAISFYPFFTDLVGPEHLVSLRRYLLNPEVFWTPYPVPASPKTDPYFSATPAWKGKRTNCPWNGRTWPMTNSHVAEALAQASCFDESLRETTAEFISKFVRMMFFDGDVRRPNCFEHYNPATGHASTYRGIDDYQHSWVVDLLIKYAAGVQPHADQVVIDPFPFGLEYFALRGAKVQGHEIDVIHDQEGFRVALNGAVVHRSPEPSRITLKL